MCIGGAHSSCGKTTLAENLLSRLKGRWGAIKYTKTAFYTTLVSDRETILQDGKDTARLLKAGAVDVAWIQSPIGELEEVLSMAMCNFSDVNGIIVEGNSPVQYLRSDLVVFVYGSDTARVKEHSSKVFEKASIVVTRNVYDPKAFIGKKVCIVKTKSVQYDDSNDEDWGECLDVIMDDISNKEIERRLCALCTDNTMSCAVARKVAVDLGVSYKLIWQKADGLGIKIVDSELGCF